MADLILIRGDRRTLAISGLIDAFGLPAAFGPSDVLTWTAKADHADSAGEALIVKSSATGGIVFVPGGSTATVTITAADWTNIQLRADLRYVWDLQLLVGGDPDQAVTLTEGTGIIRADVTGNPITDPIPTGGLIGPCTTWVTLNETVADPRAVRADGTPLPRGLLQEKIDVASEILYRLSGSQYAGVCSDVVRPTSRWYRDEGATQNRWVYGNQWPRTIDAYTSRNPHRNQGSTALQEVTLGAAPIRAITEVRVNGVVLNSATYRVDDRRWLVNLDLANPWPVEQDFTLDPLSTNGPTFQVIFTYGQAPPRAGVAAAKRYAIEFAKGASGDACLIPERVLSLQAPGVSYALLDPMLFLDKGLTGIYEVDVFLRAVNPNGNRRRSAVLSPDRPRPVRRTAVTPGS